jgi:hypothetical protein
MNRIKPSVLANALGISTDALRKQRIRDTSPYEYEVIEGRVFYDLDSIPLGVRANIEKLTTKKTKQNHYDIKSPRYWSSIGKINDQRIRNKKKRIEVEVQDRLAVERDQQMKRHEPRTIKKQYAYFIDCTNVRPNWQPLDRLNKKKKIESYY